MNRVVLGRYRIEFKAGKSPAGSVFRGSAIGTEASVSVTLVRQDAQQPLRPGPSSERALVAAAAIDHSGVAAPLAIAVEDGAPLLVAPWPDGDSLEQILSLSPGGLALAEAAPLVERLLDALSAAHDAGLVHCALEPAHVFMVRRASGMQVTVTGFGLAHLLVDSGVDRSDARLVTNLPWRAPEQREDPTLLTPAVDVYGVGALLYHLLSAAPPFGLRPDDGEALAPLHGRVEGVSEAIDALLRRALASAPGQRFPSVKAMREALVSAQSSTEESVASASSSPRPPGPGASQPSESSGRVASTPPQDQETVSRMVGFSAAGTVAADEMPVISAPLPKPKHAKRPPGAVPKGGALFSAAETVCEDELPVITAPVGTPLAGPAAPGAEVPPGVAVFSAAETVCEDELPIIPAPAGLNTPAPAGLNTPAPAGLNTIHKAAGRGGRGGGGGAASDPTRAPRTRPVPVASRSQASEQGQTTIGARRGLLIALVGGGVVVLGLVLWFALF